jgi:hypothetical protein
MIGVGSLVAAYHRAHAGQLEQFPKERAAQCAAYLVLRHQGPGRL